MEKVAEFIAAESIRQALARLCRLALVPTPDGRLTLNDWENRHQTTRVDAARERLDDRESPPTAAEVYADPLVWLRALDEHIHATISPDAQFECMAMDDGIGRSWVVALDRPNPGGALHRQFGNLAKWLDYVAVIAAENSKGIPVSVQEIPRSHRDWTADSLASNFLKVAVVNFDDGVQTLVEPDGELCFTCNGLDDAEKRHLSALDFISKARAQGAQILVMPELTITEEIRDRLIDALRDAEEAADGADHDFAIPIIVLGSFHEGAVGHRRNHTVAVSGFDGTPLVAGDKRRPVTFSDPSTGFERKETLNCSPTPITCLVTPIGIISLTICKDLFDGDPAEVLKSLPLSWLLVPSMSDKITPHENRAADLHKLNRTVVVVANQEMTGPKPPAPGFVQAQGLTRCCAGLKLIEVAGGKSRRKLGLKRVK